MTPPAAAPQPTPQEAWQYLYDHTQPSVVPTRAIYANIETALRVLKPAPPAPPAPK
jgi:hypothetical protein